MRRLLWVILFVGLAGLVVIGWRWRATVMNVTQAVQRTITPQPSVRFAAVGDNHGINPVYQQIIADLKAQKYAFLVNLADTSELGKTEEFQAVKELESTLPFPVYHTAGNHDIKSDPTRQSFLNVFGHARWYAIDQGRVHLIMLDNADRKVGFPNAELDWLEQDLAAHAHSVNIIAYHRPFDLPLAAVFGDDETATSSTSNTRFKAIISQANVKQILTAHLHTYLPYEVAGVPVVISGGGGDPAQVVLGGPTNNYFHYLDITVRGSDVTISPVRVTLNTTTPE